MTVEDTESLALLLKAAGIPEGTPEAEALATVRAHSEAAGDFARLCDALREFTTCTGLLCRGQLARTLDGHSFEIAGINAPHSPDEEPA